MDPRFRRRWVDARREEGRRRFRVLVGVTAVVALGCAGWAATDSVLLDLDRVVVEGVVHTSPEEARFASGLRIGEPMLDIDEGAVDRAVEALPWVKQASVRREWPGRVRIVVVEREPVAVAEAAPGAMALIDGTGRVLEWVPVPPPGLPVLAGLRPAGSPGTTLGADGVASLQVALALPAELRPRISGLAPAAGDGGEVELRLDPEGMVRLGPPDDLDRKFTAIRAVLAQVDLGNLAVLDVRRPETPVLTRRDTAVKVSTPRVG
ncbi:MAG TPA: FtsQ-type POTRA domain-containing protein [Acidimicrobiales bacterium]|nr:FtsQ-type POTRA domain-containing protein [Acidimicrobiales bacterium]HWI03512.1 FtsQ-type POTRA domain-containing protein [Acidimicrobiales bacterium]